MYSKAFKWSFQLYNIFIQCEEEFNITYRNDSCQKVKMMCYFYEIQQMNLLRKRALYNNIKWL